jgi:putative transposase
MTRLTRLSAAAQAHYVVLRSVPEISLIPFDKNIEKLFQIFSDGSRAYNTDISAFAVFTDQIHLLLTPREKAEDLSRFVQQLSRLYSHYFNDEFSRNGKIWQGRFESSLLQGKGRL